MKTTYQAPKCDKIDLAPASALLVTSAPDFQDGGDMFPSAMDDLFIL